MMPLYACVNKPKKRKAKGKQWNRKSSKQFPRDPMLSHDTAPQLEEAKEKVGTEITSEVSYDPYVRARARAGARMF